MRAGRRISKSTGDQVGTPNATAPTYWSFETLRISDRGISEVIGGRRILFIPKDQVQYLETKFGSHAERPKVQMIDGVILVALGLVGLYLALIGGIRGLYWGVGFLGFGVIGVYCLYEALKKGHFFSVTCLKETRKIKISKEPHGADFPQFVEDASALGYQIRLS